MSSLSITLTALSIIVALRSVSCFLTEFELQLSCSISIIEVMSLIGEKCQSCKEAAEAEDGGGLAGAWWRAWAFVSASTGMHDQGVS
jgi:high-affinity nickel-transport protein